MDDNNRCIEERTMKIVSSCRMVGLLTLAVTATIMTGCFPAIPLTVTVHNNLEIPAISEFPDGERTIPEEFQRYFGDWDEVSENLETMSSRTFLYKQARTICAADILESVKNEAFRALARRAINRGRLRNVSVQSIRLEASQGDFSWITDIMDKVTFDDTEYYFFLDKPEPTVLHLEPAIPFLGQKPDLAGVFDAENFDGCVQNYVEISGTLPPQKCVFNVIVNLEIGLSWFSGYWLNTIFG